MYLNYNGIEEFKLPQDWIYRGEGNCNLVLSLKKQRKILRIRKTLKQKSLFYRILNWLMRIFYYYFCYGTRIFNEEIRDLKFYKRIIRPLIGEEFACDGQQVFLSKKQINYLEKKLQHIRPNDRKHKSLQYGRAAIFDDYAFMPFKDYPFRLNQDTFAIEIKPKQGWLCFNEKKFLKCLYCMNQYLKLKQNKIKHISTYCPLDLFSGDYSSMLKAIDGLVKNPQNNLRIFKNGQLCYSEDDNGNFDLFTTVIRDFFKEKSVDFERLKLEFYDLIIQALLLNCDNNNRKLNDCDIKQFCQWNDLIRKNSLQNQLPQNCVLERILSVQMLDVEGYQYYYNNYHKKTLADYDYIEKLLNKVQLNQGTCLKCSIMSLNNENNDLFFVPYLISAIAKDCSLMLTFQKIDDDLSLNFDNRRDILSTNFGQFAVNIGVFDLYPKPMNTIEKHHRRINKCLELID